METDGGDAFGDRFLDENCSWKQSLEDHQILTSLQEQK